MNLKNHLILFTLIITGIVLSCKTDFEINAPYQDIPVIYATIDQTLDTQYVKINKTFLGGGNNITYASINDSILFKNIVATVDEIKNGAVTNSYTLQEKWIKNIQPGIFNTDSQRVYYFVPNPPLDIDASYHLTVNIDNGRKEATAKTNLVADFNFNALFINQVRGGLNLRSAQGYNRVNVRWRSAEGAIEYESGLFFYYDEHTSTDTIERKITWSFGNSKAINTNGGQDLSKEILGDKFYQYIAAQLNGNANEANITRRKFKRLAFFVSAAGVDLSTYIDVNRPSNSIVSERPSFTNITGGLGIFSSRTNLILNELSGANLKLSLLSIEELKTGQYTGHLKFF